MEFKEFINRIKSLSLDQKINILVCAATLITVIITNRTLNEMKLQRNLSYSPAIVMEDITFTVSWNSKGYFSDLYIENSDGQNDIFGNGVGLLNIGLGVAKDITFSWNASNYDLYNKEISRMDKLLHSYIIPPIEL